MNYSEYKIEDFQVKIFRDDYHGTIMLHLYWNELIIHIEKLDTSRDYDRIWDRPHKIVAALIKAGDRRTFCKYKVDYGPNKSFDWAIYSFRDPPRTYQ